MTSDRDGDAEADAAPPAEAPGPPGTDPAGPPAARPTGRRALAAVAALTVLGLVAALVLWSTRDRAPDTGGSYGHPCEAVGSRADGPSDLGGLDRREVVDETASCRLLDDRGRTVLAFTIWPGRAPGEDDALPPAEWGRVPLGDCLVQVRARVDVTRSSYDLRGQGWWVELSGKGVETDELARKALRAVGTWAQRHEGRSRTDEAPDISPC
jgi:hypothetical protein